MLEASARPHDERGFHVWTGPRDELDALLGARSVRVQDPTSAHAVGLTSSLSPSLILDLCAGRGTKTGQLADAHPGARVYANVMRIAPARTSSVKRSPSIPGLRRIPYGVWDRLPGPVDLLVLDVPCSNTGVLARRVEARHRYDAENLETLIGLQRQIIADGLAHLDPDSARCCTRPAASTRRRTGSRSTGSWRGTRSAWCRTHATMPAGTPGGAPTAYHDGGYAALLQRQAT